MVVGDGKGTNLSVEQGKSKQKPKQNVWKEPESLSRFPVSQRRMIAAGVAAGLLPLVHAHSFIVVMGMGACLALIFRQLARLDHFLCRRLGDCGAAVGVVHLEQRCQCE